MTVLTRLIPLIFAFSMLALPSHAQNLFAPVVKVNDSIITAYEIQQRARFLDLLRVPGANETLATEALIEDRLKEEAARRAGVQIGVDEIELGLAEFAQRANLTTEQFLSALADGGVSPQTFRDFVRSGLYWRTFVQGRFAPRARLTEAEIDRALALAGTRSGARVLVAEIVLPTPPNDPVLTQQSQTLANDLQQSINSTASFAQAARQFSVAPSRDQGGRREWLALNSLPPQLVSVLLPLGPGEVSDPVPIANGQALALFQVRALEELAPVTQQTLSVDYVQLILPFRDGQVSPAARNLRRQIDVCDDLYPFVRDLPPGAFIREVVPVEDLSPEIAAELAALDPGEISTNLRAGNAEVFLMLCGRTTELAEGAREQIQSQLFNQRIASYADSFLEELKADAIIRR